jgi:hypothetical protein
MITNEKHLGASGAIRLERVVLRRDLVVVEAADEGNLLQDVGLHARDAVEEEDGEDAGGGAEGGADGAPAGLLEGCCCCCRYMEDVGGYLEGGLGLHPEESAGSVLAELDFGDVVAVGHWVSFCAWIRVFPRLMGILSQSAYLGPYWLLNDL